MQKSFSFHHSAAPFHCCFLLPLLARNHHFNTQSFFQQTCSSPPLNHNVPEFFRTSPLPVPSSAYNYAMCVIKFSLMHQSKWAWISSQHSSRLIKSCTECTRLWTHCTVLLAAWTALSSTHSKAYLPGAGDTMILKVVPSLRGLLIALRGADQCDHPKCGWLGRVIFVSGGLRSRYPLYI